MTDHTLQFSEPELARIRLCAQQLNTSYVDFIYTATMQAVDECEGQRRPPVSPFAAAQAAAERAWRPPYDGP